MQKQYLIIMKVKVIIKTYNNTKFLEVFEVQHIVKALRNFVEQYPKALANKALIDTVESIEEGIKCWQEDNN